MVTCSWISALRTIMFVFHRFFNCLSIKHRPLGIWLFIEPPWLEKNFSSKFELDLRCLNWGHMSNRMIFFCSEYSSVAYQKMHKEETNAMTYLCFSLIKEFPWYSTKHNFSILSYSTFKQKLSMFFISLAFSVIGVLNFVVYEVIAFIHNCVVDRNDFKIIGEWCYIKI